MLKQDFITSLQLLFLTFVRACEQCVFLSYIACGVQKQLHKIEKKQH